MKSVFSFLALLLIAFHFAPISANAQASDEEAIKQRMLERVDEIDALKIAGKIGENNVGLLEQRGPLTPEESKLMNEENADRRALYTIIGKRLGLTATVVGQGRAEELRNKSAPGVWLQDRGGKWYRKS